MNLKLQSSAAKNQAKNIELEIKKLEARETRELLGIVQVESSLFLSEPFLMFLDYFSSRSHICPSFMLNQIVTLLVVTCSSSGWHTRPI